jgi:hypothetical protein
MCKNLGQYRWSDKLAYTIIQQLWSPKGAKSRQPEIHNAKLLEPILQIKDTQSATGNLKHDTSAVIHLLAAELIQLCSITLQPDLWAYSFIWKK